MTTSTMLFKRLHPKALALASINRKRVRVAFKLPESLRKKLYKKSYFHIEEDGNVTVDVLTRYFDTLCDMTNDEDSKLKSNERLLLEKLKLEIMKAIRLHLEKLNQQSARPYVPKVSRKKTAKKVFKWVKRGLFIVYNIIMIPVSLCSGFVGFQAMLPFLIPGLKEVIIFGIAAVLTAMDFFIQGLGQAKSLKDVLHISLNNNAKRLLKVYEKQIKTINRVNALLPHSAIVKQMTQVEFKSVADITIKMNARDMEYKQQQFADKSFKKQFKESKFKKIAGWTVVGLQSIMIVGATYFAIAALLGAIAAPLLGTPIGWAIITLAIIGAIAGYICLRDDSVRSLLSPALAQFKVVKDKIRKFLVVDDFDHILQNKKAFKAEITVRKESEDTSKSHVQVTPRKTVASSHESDMSVYESSSEITMSRRSSSSSLS